MPEPPDGGGYRVATLRYELLGKRYRHDPRRGFQDTGIELLLAPPAGAAGRPDVRLTARVSLADGRPALEELRAAPPR